MLLMNLSIQILQDFCIIWKKTFVKLFFIETFLFQLFSSLFILFLSVQVSSFLYTILQTIFPNILFFSSVLFNVRDFLSYRQYLNAFRSKNVIEFISLQQPQLSFLLRLHPLFFISIISFFFFILQNHKYKQINYHYDKIFIFDINFEQYFQSRYQNKQIQFFIIIFWRLDYMISEESFKKMILEQYYKFLELTYLTEDFSKKENLYTNLNFNQYQSLTIIGFLQRIQKVQGYNQPLLALQFLTNKKIRKVVMTEFDNKNELSKHNNKMIRQKVMPSALTNLTPCFIKNELYFAFTPKSFIVQIKNQSPDLNMLINNLQVSFGFEFNMVRLNKEIEAVKFTRQNLYGDQIKNRIKKNGTAVKAIVGSVQQIKIEEFGFKKQKEMIIIISQNVVKQNGQFFGRCKIIIKAMDNELTLLQEIMQTNHLFLFSNLQLMVTEKLDIFYLMKYTEKDQVYQISENLNNRQSDQKAFLKLKVQKLAFYDNICIERNYKKFTVVVKNVQLIYGTYQCISCLRKKVSEKCSCGQFSGRLSVWGLVWVADDSASAFLSIQNQALFDLLQINEFIGVIQQHLLKSRENVIYRSSNYDNKKILNDCHFPQGLQTLAYRLRYSYIQKSILGYSKMDLKKIYKNLDEDEKIRILQSLGTFQKITAQETRLNPSGFIKTINKKQVYIPLIQVKLAQ